MSTDSNLIKKYLTVETSNPSIKFKIGYANNKWLTQVIYQGQDQVPIVTCAEHIYYDNSNRNRKIKKILSKFDINEENANILIDDIMEYIKDKCQELTDISSLEPKNSSKLEEEESEEVFPTAVYNRAIEIIKSGKALDFIVDKHLKSCAGVSKKYSLALSCAFATTHIKSSNCGIHVKLDGSSGFGKSTLVNNYFDLTLPNTRMFTSMSGKNMFYDTDLRPNMVIGIDEFENADSELIRTIKLSTSKFQDNTTLKTVIDFKSVQKIIHKRIAFILLSVLPLDNPEMLSRFLTLTVPSDEAYKIEINEIQKRREQKLITKNLEPDFDTLVCRCIYSLLNSDIYDIRIPFAPVIEWQNTDHTRNWEIFSDIIRSVAFYNILNREYFYKESDPETGVYLATYEDFTKATEIYSEMAENNGTKLSNKELKLIQALIEARNKNIEEQLNKNVDKKEFYKKLENHNLSDYDIDDLSCFGVMDVKGLATAINEPDRQVEYMVKGERSKKVEGLTYRIVGLHCEKCSCKSSYKNGERSVQKSLIWYDGPDNIKSRDISCVPRDICEAETKKCKIQWLKAWEEEDMKWAN